MSSSLYSDEEIKQETVLASQLKQLHAQIEELSEENKALLEQHKLLKEHCDKSSEISKCHQDTLAQNRRQKEQIEKLAFAVQDREKKIRELQQFEYSYKKNFGNKVFFENQLELERKTNKLLQAEIQELSKKLFEMQKQSAMLEDFEKQLREVQTEKQEALEEVQALQSQFSTLKRQVIESQNAHKIVSHEKTQLEVFLGERNRLIKEIEEEMTSIKQDLSKGMIETKDIEERYLILVHEKATLHNKSNHLEQLLELNNKEITNLQYKCEEATKKEEYLKIHIEQSEAAFQEKHRGFLSELQKRINELEDNLEKHHNQLHEREREIEGYLSQIQVFSQEKIRTEDILANMTRHQEEQEARIKVAQQHLGKKVKEATLMNEKLDEQKVQIASLQESLNHFKAKMSEMESSFEKQLQEEKKQQEKLKENLGNVEKQASEWKEQYLKVQDNLKTLEEKQQQLQTLFTNLGHVIGAQQNLQTSHSPIPSTSKAHSQPKSALSKVETPHFEGHLQQEISSFVQPSLFDVEQPRKMRQNLFD